MLADFLAHIQNVFSTIQFKDCIDILVVAYLIYSVLRFIKQTRAGNLLRGLVLLLVLIVLAKWLNLSAVGYLMNNVLQLSFITIIIVFQPELRSLLEKLGRINFANVLPFSRSGNAAGNRIDAAIEHVCECCDDLSKRKIGGLMVFENKTKLGDIAATGTYLHCDLSAQMLVTIFFPKTPLHDGAVFIEDFKIVSAGCLLPLSQRLEISKALGTRHRAAVGLSEISDALIVVVSEETGKISYAQNGEIHLGISLDELRNVLKNNFISDDRKLGASEVNK
jgi:diadenylate cyclase